MDSLNTSGSSHYHTSINLDMALMHASSASISLVLSLPLSAYLMESSGRKSALFIMQIPTVIGWIMMYYSNSFSYLIIGRILSGMSYTATNVVGSVVLGEYSSPKHRGLFSNIKNICQYVGTLIVHIGAIYFDWRVLTLVCAAPSILALLNIWTWPESPSFKIKQDCFDEASKTFYWLRGTNAYAIKEFESMVQSRKMDSKEKESNKMKFTEFFAMWKKRDFIKPTVILVCGLSLLDTTGRHYVPAFAAGIVKEINPSNLFDPYVFSIILDIISIVATLIVSVLTNVLGRRILLFSSGLVCIFFMVSLSMYQFLIKHNFIPYEGWIPLTVLALFYGTANTGVTAIPVTLCTELYPLKYRAVGSALQGLVYVLPITMSLNLTPILLQTIRVEGTFLVYSLMSIVLLSVMYFMLPETKNKTLQEIENYFKYGTYDIDTPYDISKEKMLH